MPFSSRIATGNPRRAPPPAGRTGAAAGGTRPNRELPSPAPPPPDRARAAPPPRPRPAAPQGAGEHKPEFALVVAQVGVEDLDVVAHAARRVDREDQPDRGQEPEREPPGELHAAPRPPQRLRSRARAPGARGGGREAPWTR